MSEISRRRYQEFVRAYRARKLEDSTHPAGPAVPGGRSRKEYLRDYMAWLRPHRYAVGFVFTP